MPNRIIKESICYSDDLDKLTAFEETVFYRLLVRVDDFGRIDGRANYLKSTLFVTKTGVSEKNVSEAVARLASLGLARLYEVGGKPFLCLPKWHLHQRVRDSKAKFPEPPQNFDDFRSSPQLAATRCESPLESNPIQSGSQSGSQSGRACAREELFSEFWEAYPKKKSRGDAEKAWKSIHPTRELVDRMLCTLAKSIECKDWTKDGGQFIPYPASWLRAKGWEDEIEQARASPQQTSADRYKNGDKDGDSL